MNRKSGTFFILAAASALTAACDAEGREDNQNLASAEQSNTAAAKGETPNTTIAQTLSRSGDHSTMAGAVKSAGLEATMSGSEPYTVFAPTNAAFQKVEGSADLMKPEAKGQLTGILTYHIVPGVVTAKDLAAAIERGGGKAEIATVGGGNITAAKNGDAIVITDAKGGQARVIEADRLQSNGVVHVIDGVLMPS